MEECVVRQHKRRAVTSDLAEDCIPAVNRQAASLDHGHAREHSRRRGPALETEPPLPARTRPRLGTRHLR